MCVTMQCIPNCAHGTVPRPVLPTRFTTNTATVYGAVAATSSDVAAPAAPVVADGNIGPCVVTANSVAPIISRRPAPRTHQVVIVHTECMSKNR